VHDASPAGAIARPGARLVALARAMRPYQWSKNALVGVPLVASHQINPQTLILVAQAFVAFSLCASCVYLLNDIVDLPADRLHPTKRARPFASGELPIVYGLVAAPLLLIAAFAVAAAVSWSFMAVLAGYLGATTAYTFWLKRKLMIDTVTLAGLYALRVFAGAVAIRVGASEWIIAFSMFIFLSLALLKRYSELAMLFDRQLPDPINRNYKVADLPAILSLAGAAGYCSVVVITLYVSSDAVKSLYAHPRYLWLVCPLLLYWVSRALMLCHRRLMHDDPIVFALRDRVSWAVGGLVLAVGLAAAIPQMPSL
jgi:4-hydroxybenzoate polyprenyltransferase